LAKVVSSYETGLSGLTDYRSPVIDGHVDLPILVREVYGNNVDKMDLDKDTVGLKCFYEYGYEPA
jgi:hypothetical protein